VFVRRGAFVRHFGSRQHLADANQVILFNRGQGYRVSHPVRGGDHCTVFSIRQDQLRAILSEHDPSAVDLRDGWFRSAQISCSQDLFVRHLLLLRAARRRDLTDLAVEEQVLMLAAEIASSLGKRAWRPRNGRRQPTVRAHHESVERIKGRLADRFSAPMGIEELAEHAHLSPYHMCRVFREGTGESIHSYRTQLRLRSALYGLAEGACDLARLAIDLGFSDQSHFTNAFRRAFAMSPSAFRKGASTRLLREMSTNLQV
jgi:AraC-like DNA-binding protein